MVIVDKTKPTNVCISDMSPEMAFRRKEGDIWRRIAGAPRCVAGLTACCRMRNGSYAELPFDEIVTRVEAEVHVIKEV